MKLSNNIRTYRKANKLSQEEFADKFSYAYLKVLGDNSKDAFSAKAVSKWENERAMPTVNCVVVLAKLMNCSIDSLIHDNMLESDCHLGVEHKDDTGLANIEAGERGVLLRAIKHSLAKKVCDGDITSTMGDEKAHFTAYADLYYELKCLDGNIYITDKVYALNEIHKNYKMRRMPSLQKFSTKRYLQSLLYDGDSELYKINKECYACSDWFHANRLDKLARTLSDYNAWKFEPTTASEQCNTPYRLYDVDSQSRADDDGKLVESQSCQLQCHDKNNVCSYSICEHSGLTDSYWARENNLSSVTGLCEQMRTKAKIHIKNVLKSSFGKELVKLNNIVFCTIGTRSGIVDDVLNWDCYVKYSLAVSLENDEARELLWQEHKGMI